MEYSALTVTTKYGSEINFPTKLLKLNPMFNLCKRYGRNTRLLWPERIGKGQEFSQSEVLLILRQYEQYENNIKIMTKKINNF